MKTRKEKRREGNQIRLQAEVCNNQSRARTRNSSLSEVPPVSLCRELETCANARRYARVINITNRWSEK